METNEIGEHDDHETCADEVCPGCVAAVQAAIDFDIGDGEEEFDEGFGDLIDDMHDALAALHRAHREKYTDKHNEIANSSEAATKLVQIASAVAAAIRRGRDLLST